MSELPSAEFIIIGGGAIGCGVAYALAITGKTDVLLLDRAEEVGQITTSQGAGLCGQPRSDVERIKLAMHSVTTFRELQETEAKPDWHEVGSLRIALSDKRAEEFRKLKRAADDAELETHFIDSTEAGRRWPLIDFTPVRSVLWCPSDGWVTPRSVAKSYEHACRKAGVRFAMSTALENIIVKDGRVTGVKTDRGEVRGRYVINAAGANAYHVAKLVGLELPIVPVRHEYYVTVAMDDLAPDLPCIRIPELTLYARVREGGLLLGGWEARSLQEDPRAYPLNGAPKALDTDWEVLNGFEESLVKLFPKAKGKEKKFIGKGWPTFTPDGRFIIGESSQVKGFVMAGGCNAHGISGSGGIGKLVVDSLFAPQPSAYLRSLSPDRFTDATWTWEKARACAAHAYETYYGV